MANQASFHAKISADARQFIEQVNEAAEALQALTGAYDKVSGGAKSGARSRATDAKKDQRSAERESEAALDRLHNKQMQNIRQENQARQQGVRGQRGSDRMAGPARGFGDEAGLVVRRAEAEARVTRQKQIQQAEARQAFQEARKLRVEDERRLALQRKLEESGKMAYGPVRQGAEGMRDLNRLQERYTARQKEINDQKKLQLQRERSIAKANREQLDAMVTGRYALYDMANAYRGIAENAFRMARATASTLIRVAEFESAFTAVERAASLQIGTDAFMEVRQSLIDLSREIPVAFDEISEIATLGAQMGIATADLADFTEQIAAFSAVTGATIDETAEKFGRISSLANVPSEEFNNLASSVLFAGFNAVATEKEILAMAESIAAAAANSGYAADQVVGLATALASLGIRPEQARGVILRLFNDINRAVEGTTDNLGAFAGVMGTSTDEARNLFRTDPERFFTGFLQGLSEVENLTGTLDELGIVNTREINVLQRLSGNMDVYSKSIREASESYAEGTALAEIYADTADNLDAKFQRLLNSFAALQAEASAGFGEALKPIIEGLINLTTAATEFSKTGLGQAIIPVITGFAALTAAFAGMKFVGNIAIAQLLAMRVAILKMGEAGNAAANPFRGLTNAITGNLYVTDALTGRTQFLTKAQVQAAISSGKLDEAIGRQVLTSQRASVATRALSASMSILGIAMSALAVIGIGATVIEMSKLNNEIGKNVGGVDALADAISRDTEAYKEGGDAIKVYTSNLNKNSEANKSNADAADLIIDAQGDVQREFKDTADAVNLATIAIGENFKQLLLQDIAESEPLKDLVESMENDVDGVNELFEAIGASPEDLIEAAARDPEDGAYKFLIDGIQQAMDNIDKFSPKTQQLVRDLNTILQAGSGATDPAEFIRRLSLESSVLVEGLNGDTYDVARALGVMTSGIQTSTDAAIQQKRVLEALGIEMPNTASAMEEFGNASEDTETQVSGLSKTLRTVLDYSSDIGGIFDRIMGIELGEAQALDNIADGWEKIQSNADDAQEAISDANAEILELTADKDVLEYQLSVAERYGDEQRAAVIRAKLAKIDNKLADENEKLAEAQSESEMSLTGNTKAARENRDAIIGLVGNYSDLIQAAIDSGMQGQELEDYIRDLKEEFIAQGESVGFSRGELETYSGIFDGFITTVDKVDPRVDIEFDSNISAAEQAFDEYMAKLRAADGFVTKQTFETEVQVIQPYSLRPIVLGSDVRLFRYGLQQGKLTPFQYYKMVYGMDPREFSDVNSYADTSYLYQGRAEGGLITGPGGPKSDVIPTMLSNGEYVIQASAVKGYGVDFMNALNQQRLPMASMPSNVTNGTASTGSTIVYLSPQDRALLRQVADRPVNLYADNGKIAQSANAGNVTLAQRGLN